MIKHIKGIALILSIILVIGVFAGCSSKQSGNQPSASNSSSSAQNSSGNGQKTSQGPEPITLPIVKEPLKLTWWNQNWDPDQLKTFDDIAGYQELQKRTGIDIEWQHPPTGQETEQFNLMIASQEYPDIIYYNWYSYPGGPAKALQDGVMIKLNDLIDKYAPNYKKVLDENPDIRKQLTLDDGSIIMFAQIDLDLRRMAYYGFQVRKDWLDKLSLNPPKTIDDWYNMLKAFKNNDPNGNGQADEIPFLSDKNAGFRNFAAAWGIQVGFYRSPQDGKIKYGPEQPEYKDFLTTMAQWYKEGLIDPEYASVDSKNFDAKMTGNKGGSYCGYVGGNMLNYLTLLRKQDPTFDLMGVTWPIGPAGKAYSASNDLIQNIAGFGAVISVKNQHPIESVKLLDYCYSDEGETLLNWGIEGVSYTEQNGQRTFTDLILNNPNGLSPQQAIVHYALPIRGHTKVMDYEAQKQISYRLPEQVDATEKWASADKSLLLPKLLLTPDEATNYANIMSEVNTYQSEMFNKFVMGQEPLQNFDKYVETLKSMGIDEAVKMQQAAYDRFNARK